MKNLYYFLFLVLVSTSVKAQIVTIPDANFKYYLLNYQPVIDTNSDGEIQVSEALVVTSLDLHAYNINSLSGIEAFINLTDLNSSSNNITNIDNISSLINLVNLYCHNNNLTSLNVTNLINLQTLNCNDNPNLNTLILNSATNLRNIKCKDCQLNSIDLSSQINLTDLAITGGDISTIDFSACTFDIRNYTIKHSKSNPFAES